MTTYGITKARRAWESAAGSLAAAERLRGVLEAGCYEDPLNDYMRDALASARELVAEMDRELDIVMETYSPEECGL